VPAQSVAVMALPEGGKQVSVVMVRVDVPEPATRKR
jgi:hypothetical protein